MASNRSRTARRQPKHGRRRRRSGFPGSASFSRTARDSRRENWTWWWRIHQVGNEFEQAPDDRLRTGRGAGSQAVQDRHLVPPRSSQAAMDRRPSGAIRLATAAMSPAAPGPSWTRPAGPERHASTTSPRRPQIPFFSRTYTSRSISPQRTGGAARRSPSGPERRRAAG